MGPLLSQHGEKEGLIRFSLIPMKYLIRSLLIRIGPHHKEPWWWSYIDHNASRCQLDYLVIPVKRGKLNTVFSPSLIVVFIRVAFLLVQARRKYRYIFTFECGWESFLVAFIQTMTGCHRPRHIILQFIMREKNDSLRSKMKYAFMRWCFVSVDRFICSSRSECKYYGEVFGLDGEKFHYIPFHSDPYLLTCQTKKEEGFLLSAGRTFRDYTTLLAAFKNLEVPLRIVASRSSIDPREATRNVEIQYDLPGPELIDLMSRCMAVVLPLENRMISIGQSVLLQAMTLGKAVIATRVNGTEDYIEHMKTGILVPPNDPGAIQAAVSMLIGDGKLRSTLGLAAQERVKQMHLPRHYANAVSSLLQ